MKRSAFKSKESHKGFRKPDYPALLAKQIAKRKPGAMEMDRAKLGHVPMLCEVCGALSFVSPRRLKEGPNRCRVHRKKQLRAKPDAKLAAWGREVRKRDGNRCQWPGGCRTGDSRIDPHHISPRGRRRDLRYVVSNGVCLCRFHHSFVHDNPAISTPMGLLSTETFELAEKERRAV